ncbi:MAG TPA: O-antigen ligase family protein [Dongiaceae bacterium]|nr:O-antigen ligase family protein [Dongiaceae bacterium]
MGGGPTSFGPGTAGGLRPGAEWWRPVAPAGARTGARRGDSIVTEAQGGGSAPLVALQAFIVVLLLAPQALFPILAPFRLALLAAGGGIAMHLLDRFLAHKPISILTREIALAGCLAAWAAVGVPFSYWPGGSISLLLNLFIKSLAIFWLIANIVGTPARFSAVTTTLVIASVPLALVAILHFVSGDLAPGGNYREYKRIAGYNAPLTQNPNDLALTLNIILPFSVAHLVRARSTFARVILPGVVLLVATAIVLTFSRAGFLALAAILGLYLFKLARSAQRHWLIAVVLLALLAVPFLPGSYVDRIGTIADMSSDQSGSSQARWDGMVAAARLAVTHPLFGVGAGMNILALNELHGVLWRDVHNVYLEYATDLGLPGLALFLALFWSCWSRARRTERMAAGVPGLEDLYQYGVAVEASLIAFAVAGMFHPSAYHFYFYIIAGLAVALGTLKPMEVLPVSH